MNPEYFRALSLLQKCPAQLTDWSIAQIRSVNPQLARLAEDARLRAQRGEAFAARVREEREEAERAEEERKATWDKDRRRRQALDNIAQRAAWTGRLSDEELRVPKQRERERTRGKVRLLTPEDIQRDKDRRAGIVRLSPRFRQ